MTFNFLHDHWTTAVQDYLDGKPLMEVHTAQSFVDMENPPGRQNILLIDRQGNQLTDTAITSLRYENGQGVQLPVDMYIVHESAPDGNLPKVIRMDCTGLGGHDLGGLEPWHICLRSDRHGQNIYGPSLAILETTHLILSRVLCTRWRLVLLKPCMSSSPCTTLPLIVLQAGTLLRSGYLRLTSLVRMKDGKLPFDV